MSTSSNKTALVIDANALIHRAWHALPSLTAPDGRVVNAVYGFASVLIKILASERPTYLAVCWDTPEPTYRHKANADYKAQRVEQPDEFYAQIPLVKELVVAYGGTNVELPGYEADDLLATIATICAQNKIETTLLTSDKDIWQMIGPYVRVISFKKGVSETMILDEAVLKEVTGLTPEQIPDYKALRGDPSDNLKGVAGIGEKTATELLLRYKTFEGIFEAAHDPKSVMTASVRNKLLIGEQAGRDTLPLVRLITDAPLPVSLQELVRRPVVEADLRQLFHSFGFKTLLSRVFGGKKPEAKVTQSMDRTVQEHISSSQGNVTHAHDPKKQTVAELIKDIKNEGVAYIQITKTDQASLFVQSPVFALGSAERSVSFSEQGLQDPSIASLIRELLGDASIKKIGYGLKDVWHWAHARGLTFAGIFFDGELAAYLLTVGGRAFDLGSIAMLRLNLTLPDGDERVLFEIDVIRRLFQNMAAELKQQKLDQIMDRFEVPLIAILGQMEAQGILIDQDYFKVLVSDFRAEKSRLEGEMEQLSGQPFNPASPQQLAHILFDVLKLSSKGIKRGKTGISTAASELEKLEGMHPLIEKISEYREVAKLLSTYVESLPQLADGHGRIHTTYNQLGAATGRMSSLNPNLQNIPIRTELGRKIRRGFIAARDFVLLSCDYSQIELRVIAALAKDERMIEAFTQGVDIHTATAAAIWNVSLQDVSKDQRRAAKAINFGIIYGQGPVGLSKVAGVPFDEAKRFIAEYFRVYAGVHAYLEQTRALAHAQGYVETLFGRRRSIADINSPLPQLRAGAERMAINMPVQGTAADIMKAAMIEVAMRLPQISPKSRLLLQVHDELVFEVPTDEVNAIAAQLVEIMESVEKIGVPIVVEAKAGTNWDGMTKV